MVLSVVSFLQLLTNGIDRCLLYSSLFGGVRMRTAYLMAQPDILEPIYAHKERRMSTVANLSSIRHALNRVTC